MRILLMLFVFLSIMFMSCEVSKSIMCKGIVPAYTTVIKGISDRWECEYDLVYSILVKPVNDKFCPLEDRKLGFIAPIICKFTMGIISSYSASKIADKFKCDSTLVLKDIKHMDKVCSLLSFI